MSDLDSLKQTAKSVMDRLRSIVIESYSGFQTNGAYDLKKEVYMLAGIYGSDKQLAAKLFVGEQIEHCQVRCDL